MLSKREAKKRMAYLVDNAVMIKCCYCQIKDTCKTRVNKEKTEKLGIKALCTLTPNRPKSFVKKKKMVR